MASKGLQWGLKPSEGEEASKGLEGGLKGAAFSAEAGFEDACKGALTSEVWACTEAVHSEAL